MPGSSYMPAAKADQVAWSDTFNTVVGGSAETYGISAPMMAQFNTINTNLQTAWAASQDESTRTRVTVNQRDQLIKQMKASAKNLVSIIQGTPSVTPDMLIAAKLTVRKTKPTPVPVPSETPYLVATQISGRTVTLELRQTQIKRGRPSKVALASIFTAPAGTSIQDVAAWTFYTNTNKTMIDIAFPPSSTGDTQQITAFWSNTRTESGPAAQPVTVNLPASGQLPGTAMLKVAA